MLTTPSSSPSISYKRNNSNISLEYLVGDVGATLFSPLQCMEGHSVVHRDPKTRLQSSSSEPDIERIPLTLLDDEDQEWQIHAPRLLSLDQLQQLVDHALPWNLQMYPWRRLFSIAKDGDVFQTLLERCACYSHTLMVLKTTEGVTMGGFASDRWKVPERATGSRNRYSYFGRGTCFLFSNHGNSTDSLEVYKWSGRNDYCQICDPQKGVLAFGGGDGHFGLLVEDSFLRGSSGPCETFSNPILCPGGYFEIVDLEVYGLESLVMDATKGKR